jgi:raffinose/stachyose/melibiose transport system substrate-binding protein
MRRQVRISLVGVVAAAALAVTGCTGGPLPGSASPESSSSPGTADTGPIRYLVEQPEDPATLKALKEHIKTYEAQNPGTVVKVEAMPSENMRTVLQTQLRSGEGPDVFSWGSGPGYAGALAQAGLLHDLTSAYQQYQWPVYDFAKEQVTFDGKIVGIPGEMETIGLFYNKDMFTEMGLQQPANLADLQNAAQKIKDGGKTPIAVADQEGWPGGHLLSMALSSRIGSDGMDALVKGESSWDNPDVVAALQLWKDWNEGGYFPKSPTSLTTDGAAALFYSGDAAVLPTGSWAIESIEKNTDFEVGYIPFPAEGGPGIFTGGLGSGPFVSASSKHIDASVKFLNFLASPEHGRWTVEELGTIPAYPVDTAGVKVSPLFAQVLKDTSKFSEGAGDFGINIDVRATDRFNKAMWDGVQAILSDQQTPQEVAKSLDKAAQK